MTDQVEAAAVEKTPATLQEAMEEGWNKAQEPETPSEPETVEAAKPVEVDDMPSDMPSVYKSHWTKLDAEARSTILSDRRAMAQQIAAAGREARQLRPITETLRQAVEQLPALKGMSPEQVAKDVFTLARANAAMREKPVETLMGIAQQMGVLDKFKEAIGQPVQPAQSDATQRELAALKAEVARLKNPETIGGVVQQTLQNRETVSILEAFASEKGETWGAVQGMIPHMIPVAKAQIEQKTGRRASAKDTLALAYEMATYANPETRAKMAAAQAPVTDPGRTAEQAKAKGINVRSNSSTPPAPATMREALEQGWARANRQ